jgi:serine/threonine protein kinase
MPVAVKVGSELQSRYVVSRLLGDGGFGIVWHATDKLEGREVAAKGMVKLTSSYKVQKEITRKSESMAQPPVGTEQPSGEAHLDGNSSEIRYASDEQFEKSSPENEPLARRSVSPFS